MNATPIQSNFSIGEIDPDVLLRSTLEARNRGVKTLTNFLTDSHGPAIKREGFRFLGKVGEAGPIELLCGEAVGFDTGETEGAVGLVGNITVHDRIDDSDPENPVVIPGDRLVVSKNGSGPSFGVVGTYDISTDTWTRRRIGYISGGGSSRPGATHFSGSGLGLIEQNTHIYSMVEASSNFTNVTDLFHEIAADWSKDPQIDDSWGSVGRDMEFYDESPNYLAIGFQNSDTVRIMPKADFSQPNFLYGPSGYNLRGLAWSKTLSSWLMFLEKESAPYTSQGISIVPSTNGGDIGGDVNVDPPTEFFTFNGYQANMIRGHWKDGDGNIYFAFASNDYRSATNPGAPDNSFFQKVTNSGVAVRTYDSDDTKGVSPIVLSATMAFSGQTGMTYDPTRNRTTGSSDGVVLQLDHATDEWSTCTVAGVPSATVGAAIDSNGFMWGAPRTSPITMYRHEIYS